MTVELIRKEYTTVELIELIRKEYATVELIELISMTVLYHSHV